LIGYYNNITNYFTDIHRLHKYGGYSISDINMMIPWEMEVYALQVLKDIQEENKQRGSM